ncbi:MAG: hypothetical protein ACOC04_06200, partial [Halothece sp.]
TDSTVVSEADTGNTAEDGEVMPTDSTVVSEADTGNTAAPTEEDSLVTDLVDAITNDPTPLGDSILGQELQGTNGDDTLSGDGGADVLIGVDPNTSLAGLGEIDQLQGGGGADLFVLGDENGAYYDDGDPATLGWNDYALIEDFQSSQSDQIQLYGSANDYSLGTNIPTLAQGTAIFFGENYDELIGVVKDVTGLTLDDSSVFTFVG